MLNKYTRDEFISQRVVRQDEVPPVSGRDTPKNIDLKGMASNLSGYSRKSNKDKDKEKEKDKKK